jgi:cobalamin biosynthesis protein CobC
MLEHGGRVRRAAAHFGIPQGDWLDLSTGLAPYVWPLPSVPMHAWTCLPDDDDELERAACTCYQAPQVLPVAGSQAAIQALPTLFPGARVGILEPCYAEHRHAWSSHGFVPVSLSVEDIEPALDGLEVLVAVNPNNPTGSAIATQRLLHWHARLVQRGGCLIVDEAFCDLWPDLSLASHTGRPGLIVLRSLGKFFGLAGARLGFVLAERAVLDALREQLGPWPVSGPARVVGAAALQDSDTQALWRLRIAHDGRRLEQLLCTHGLNPMGNAGLFVWVPHAGAESLYAHLARRGILVRMFADLHALRLGLPGTEAGWRRLEQALIELPAEAPACQP